MTQETVNDYTGKPDTRQVDMLSVSSDQMMQIEGRYAEATSQKASKMGMYKSNESRLVNDYQEMNQDLKVSDGVERKMNVVDSQKQIFNQS